MSHDETAATLRGIIEPVVASLGLELWGMEYARGPRRSVLRLYLDAGKEGGVDIEDCATVSRRVGVVLEVEDAIPGPYTLEVSSPGIERLFFEPAQVAAYAGREIDVALKEPLADAYPGQKRFRGVVAGVEGRRIALTLEGREVRIPWEKVKRAQLVCRPPERRRGRKD